MIAPLTAMKARYRFTEQVDDVGEIFPLTEADRVEALRLLERRPLHTAIMAGRLAEHGAVSEKHRGNFYFTRGRNGTMTGVALIGRHVLFETDTDASLEAFATLARKQQESRLVLAEAEALDRFWTYYSPHRKRPTELKTALLFDSGTAITAFNGSNCDVQFATVDQVEAVTGIHAEMVEAETGVNPLSNDRKGFTDRCAERVRRGDVLVWMSDGEVLFKTDVVSRTGRTVYIEGLWIHPKARGGGLSTRCLIGCCRRLLNGQNSLCGFVASDNIAALKLYERAGVDLSIRYKKYYI